MLEPSESSECADPSEPAAAVPAGPAGGAAGAAASEATGGRPKRKGGRPKKPPGEGRTERVYVSLAPAEAEAVRAAADAAGLSASAYARRRLLGRPVAPLVLGRRVEAAQSELVGAAGELSRVGSNLNQLARRANEGGPLGVDWVALAEEVRSTVGRVRAASEALGRAADGGDGRSRGGGPVYVRAVGGDPVGDAGGDGPGPS